MSGTPGEHRSAPDARPSPDGRQAERTRLAWRRTMLTFTVAALLVLKPALSGHVTAVDVAAVAAVALLWAAALLVTHVRIKHMSATPPEPLSRATVYPLTALVLLLAATGLAFTVV